MLSIWLIILVLLRLNLVNGIGMVKAVPTDGNSNVGECGIDDFPPDACAGMTETVVMNKGALENAFADEWTASEPDPLALQQSLIMSSTYQISPLISSW
jgi:hypothetical protein